MAYAPVKLSSLLIPGRFGWVFLGYRDFAKLENVAERVAAEHRVYSSPNIDSFSQSLAAQRYQTLEFVIAIIHKEGKVPYAVFVRAQRPRIRTSFFRSTEFEQLDAAIVAGHRISLACRAPGPYGTIDIRIVAPAFVPDDAKAKHLFVENPCGLQIGDNQSRMCKRQNHGAYGSVSVMTLPPQGSRRYAVSMPVSLSLRGACNSFMPAQIASSYAR